MRQAEVTHQAGATRHLIQAVRQVEVIPQAEVIAHHQAAAAADFPVEVAVAEAEVILREDK